MAKFSGKVGFADTKETRPGIWEATIVERTHYGEVLPNIRKLDAGSSIHGDIQLNNKISIVADPYAQEHYFAIRYVRWKGGVWEVSTVEVQSPRLI